MRHVLLSALLLLAAAEQTAAATITRIGSLAATRANATATLLADGRVLVAGGTTSSRQLEILDPVTGRSTVQDVTTPLPLIGHTATRMADGSVLLIGGGFLSDGGSGYSGSYGSYDSMEFEPASGGLTAAGLLHEPRQSHTATLLADGRVLVTGGEILNFGSNYFYRKVLASAEIFDPATRTFRTVGSLVGRRANHTATLLQDGRVLIVGGLDGEVYGGITRLDSLEIFDPRTETFATAGAMPAARGGHTATLMRDGRVLLAGGNGEFDGAAEVFDPATGKLQPLPTIGPIPGHSATLLRDGRVLIADNNEGVRVFDPAVNDLVDTMAQQPRFGDLSVTLDDGSVFLIANDGVRTFRYRPTQEKPRRRAAR